MGKELTLTPSDVVADVITGISPSDFFGQPAAVVVGVAETPSVPSSVIVYPNTNASLMPPEVDANNVQLITEPAQSYASATHHFKLASQPTPASTTSTGSNPLGRLADAIENLGQKPVSRRGFVKGMGALAANLLVLPKLEKVFPPNTPQESTVQAASSGNKGDLFGSDQIASDQSTLTQTASQPDSSLTQSDMNTKDNATPDNAPELTLDNPWQESDFDGVRVFVRGESQITTPIGNVKVRVNPEAFVTVLRKLGDIFKNRSLVDAYLSRNNLYIDLTFNEVLASAQFTVPIPTSHTPAIIHYPLELINRYIQGTDYLKKTGNDAPLIASNGGPEKIIFHELFHQYQYMTNPKLVQQAIDFQGLAFGGGALGLGGFLLLKSRNILGGLIGAGAGALVGYYVGGLMNPADTETDEKTEILLKNPAISPFRGKYFIY
jgi:hypothetical protein